MCGGAPGQARTEVAFDTADGGLPARQTQAEDRGGVAWELQRDELWHRHGGDLLAKGVVVVLGAFAAEEGGQVPPPAGGLRILHL